MLRRIAGPSRLLGWILLLAAALLPAGGFSQQARIADGSDEALWQRAQSLFDEGSYGLALEPLEVLAGRQLSPERERWVRFRLADARWRAAASGDGDAETIVGARGELENLLEELGAEPAGPDPALVEEALGDSWWLEPQSRSWPEAWQHYGAALELWAGSSDVERARRRYLDIVFRAAQIEGPEPLRWTPWAMQLPLEVLDGAVRIAQTSEDRARAHLLRARALERDDRNARARRMLIESYETVIGLGRQGDEVAPWLGEALVSYAQWNETRGRAIRREDGSVELAPDFEKALELYRSLLALYEPGTHAYRRMAESRVEEIAQPRLDVLVSRSFVPGSEVEVDLSWRNLERTSLDLYPLDLVRDLIPDDGEPWEQISLAGREAERSRELALEVGQRHAPGHRRLWLEPPPPPGAWLLVARSGDLEARALLLVTDLVAVTRAAPERTLVWVVSAPDGAPVAGAEVRRWQRPSRRASWRSSAGSSDRDGLVELAGGGGGESWIAVTVGERQTLVRLWTPGDVDEGERWRIYSFAERPLYRPGEQLSFKVVARSLRSGGGGYETPSGAELRYRLQDPRGEVWHEDRLRLNEFGSAWAAVELPEDATLGLHRLELLDRRGRVLAGDQLFRLEEFRPPEYRVEVSVRPVDGEGPGHAYRLGDEVEVEVAASYYFGAPVAGAEVELLLRESPYRVPWQPPLPQPWLAGALRVSVPFPEAPSAVVERRRLTTDEGGRVRLRIATSDAASAGDGYRYTVEARVTDSSRREVVGSSSFAATRHPYFVQLWPQHRLYRPGDRATVEIESRNANGDPVAAQGRVRVTRERWFEVWLDEEGREVEAGRLARLRARGALPPSWRRRDSGYRSEEVYATSVATDEEGEGRVHFGVEHEGYYRVTWLDSSGKEGDLADLVRAESVLWVGDESSRDLGYRYGQLDLVVDRDTAPVGGVLPVMLGTASSGRWVLLSVESDELYDWRVVRLDGQVAFVELELRDGYAPGVVLMASSVHDLRVHLDREEVRVPAPTKLLDVSLRPASERVPPGEESWLELEVTDEAGNAVEAEVAVAVTDASLFAIQEPLAMDPRAFFHARQRPHRVAAGSSLDLRPLVLLEEREEMAADDLRAQRVLADAAPSEGVVTVTSESPLLEAAPQSLAREAAAPSPGEADGPRVRSDFRSSALWLPGIRTDADGRARLRVPYPDNLTEWRATARAVTRGDRVGAAEATTRSWKPLLVRLQTPRFLVMGDRASLATVVNNNGDTALDVTVELQTAEGLIIEEPGPRTLLAQPGETRLDWWVRPERAGTVELEAAVRAADGEGDALARRLPIEEHGLERLITASGRVGPGARSAEMVLELPAARERSSTRFEVVVQPSLAVALVDALPYLIDYPYGCVEQTLSRFVPTVVTARLLSRLGIETGDVAGRLFGGLEAGARGDEGASLDRLGEMVATGLKRVLDQQNGDGGWPWWPGGASDPFMTAYASWSLSLAREAGSEVPGEALAAADRFLVDRLVEVEQDPDRLAWLLHAVVEAGADDVDEGRRRRVATALDRAWQQRDRLSPYGRALLLLVVDRLGDDERSAVLVRNLENGVHRESFRGDPETTHWGETRGWWRWSQGAVETTAFTLRALLRAAPDHPLVESTVRWLVENRRGTRWHNTRDTAIAVLALGKVLERESERAEPVSYAVSVNGRPIAEVEVDAGRVLRAPGRFSLDHDQLQDGVNRVTVQRTSGTSPLWLSASARFVSLEEPIPATVSRLALERRYLRQVPRETLLRGVTFESVPLREGESLESGDRVEVILDIETANDLEYLIFEDLKPAGLEAIELRSGEPLQGRGLTDRGEPGPERFTVYRELRDRRVALFVEQLRAGRWQIRYQLRAETPGVFHALPALGAPMYVPEIGGNSEEAGLRVIGSEGRSEQQ